MASTPKQKLRAFTLIELLTAIAIIAVLSAIILGGLNYARAYGRDAQRQAALTQIQEALENYASDHNGAYPVSSGSTWASQCAIGGSQSAASFIPGLITGSYIAGPNLPADPSMNTAANQNCIMYKSDGVNYKVVEYNIVDSPNPDAVPKMVDPERNVGKSYASVNGVCSGASDASPSWAVWSSTTSMCW
jgi:prepilin-type N-terminal cleavage/methylation domain-containing protein